jgi:hypothetical protein
MQLRNMNNLSNIMKSNINAVEPLQMVMVNPEKHRNSSRNTTNTVNPWSADNVNQIAAIDNCDQLVTNKTFTIEDYTETADLYREENCDNEPIYDEIEHLHDNKNIVECELEANKSKENKFHREDASANIKSKTNEVIYWQITAKEVATFKPCTETFIKRD